MVANKTSKASWAFETVPGTNEIVDATTVTYEFGEYNDECNKWNLPFTDNPVAPYYVYASRTPTLIELNREYPTFKHTFNPVSGQHLNWFLKDYADSTPDVDITTLDTGLTYPLSIRYGEYGGTTPANITAVGCYCIGLYVKAEMGNEVLAETEFAWSKIYDIGDEPNLTTVPSACGGATDPYYGAPQVVWDVGGDDHAITEIWKAEFYGKQKFKTVSSSNGTTQTVYTYEYEPIEIILSAIFEANTMWDDFMDRQEEDLSIKIIKPDKTSHVLYTFTNAYPIAFKKTGFRHKGHYESICILKAEQMVGFTDWETETSLETFTTHWKGVVA